MGLVVGIDVGMQSLKVLVYDSWKQVVVVLVSVLFVLDSGVDGSCEQVLVDWVLVLCDCFVWIDFLLCVCIVVLVVLGQQYGFVLVDDVGEVLVLVKLWCDISILVECIQIMDVVGGF